MQAEQLVSHVIGFIHPSDDSVYLRNFRTGNMPILLQVKLWIHLCSQVMSYKKSCENQVETVNIHSRCSCKAVLPSSAPAPHDLLWDVKPIHFCTEFICSCLFLVLLLCVHVCLHVCV